MMDETEHLLTILAEECAEVAQRCSKAIRFGIEEMEPGQGRTNAQRIDEELLDLVGVVHMLTERKVLAPMTSVPYNSKITKVNRFMAYARQRGRLE